VGGGRRVKKTTKARSQSAEDSPSKPKAKRVKKGPSDDASEPVVPVIRKGGQRLSNMTE